jgi:acyl-CoA thioesterase-2
VAVQKGRAIFNLAASFQVDESGFEHQDEMPEVPGPEGIEREIDRARRLAVKLPPGLREMILCRKPIEIRHINPVDPFKPEIQPPAKYVWFKAIDKMPDDPATHQYLLAYASDFNLVATTLYPHGHTFWQPEMQVASLDHAMWIHREIRMDDWLLYAMESPSACKARGLAIGRIFTREGKLVATVAQEGLIRYRGATAP